MLRQTPSNEIFVQQMLFTNPYSQISFTSIDVQHYSPCNTLVAPIDTSTLTFPQTFTPGVIQISSLSSSPLDVGITSATLAVSFTPATSLKSTGSVKITMPTWYSINGVATSTPIVSINDNSDCQTAISNIVISSCQFSSSTLEIVFNQYTNGQVSLRIKNFKNPVDRDVKSGFKITTLDSFGKIIDQSVTLSMSSGMSNPATISIISYTMSSNIVTTMMDFTINVQLPNPVQSNCYVQIEFPSDIPIQNSQVTTCTGTGFFQNELSTQIIAVSKINQQVYPTNYIQVQACQEASFLTISGTDGPQGTIKFSKVQVPNQQKTTSNFKISVYQDTSYSATKMIAQGVFQILDSKIQKGIATKGIFIPDDPQYLLGYNYIQKANIQYSVTFQPEHKLFYDSKITISTPQNIGLNSAYCEIFSFNGVKRGTCKTISNGWELTDLWDSDGSFLLAEYSGASLITLQIKEGKNPFSVQPAGSWTITTSNKDPDTSIFYPVDQTIFSTSFTPLGGNVVPISILSSSMITQNSQAIYTFTFTMEHDLSSGSFISIKVPSDLKAPSQYSICKYGPTLIQSTCSSPSNSEILIKINSAFSATSGQYQIQIGNFINPRTFKPTGVFQIETRDSQNLPMDSGQGFSFALTQMTTIDSVSITPLSLINGALTSYTVSIKVSQFSLQNDDVFYITFPQEVTLQGSVSCTTVSSQLSQASCQSTGKNLVVSFTSVNGGTGIFSFTINSNIKNPPSTRPSSSFTNIQFKDKSSPSPYQIAQYSQNVTVKTSQPGTIISASLTQSNTQANTLASYSILIQPVNTINKTGAIALIWPQQIQVSNSARCQVTVQNSRYTSNCKIDLTAKKITITDVFKNVINYIGTVLIEIDVTNPSTNLVNDPFYLSIYDDVDFQYIIDQIPQTNTVLVPQLQCSYPCQTCLTSNKNYCTSCYLTSPFPYLQPLQVQTCKSKCDTGFTLNGDTSSKQCVACDQSCDSCEDNGQIGDKFKCITCNSNYLFRYGQQCLQNCSSGFYEVSQSQTCDLCKAPCQSCIGDSQRCTDCLRNSSTPYLLDNSCIKSCPDGYFQSNFKCVKCQSSCKTCQNQADQCTSCDISGLSKYLYAFKCYSDCPNGTQTDNLQKKCFGCQSGCLKCDEKNQSSCLMCESPLLSLDGGCVPKCPTGYKKSFDGTSCKKNIADNIITLKGKTITLPLIYFPHVFAAILTSVIVFGGYIKDKKSEIPSNLLVFLGPINLIAFSVQAFFAFYQAEMIFFILTLIGLLFKLLMNVVFFVTYRTVMKRDKEFAQWKQSNLKATRIISGLGCIFSFKIFKLFYSNFFGLEIFKSNFDSPLRLKIIVIVFQVCNWLFSYAPIIFSDVASLPNNNWGTQFYVSQIETLLLCVAQIIISIVEFFRLKKLLATTQGYREVHLDSVMAVTNPDESSILERSQRKDMLKRLMMAGGQGNDLKSQKERLDELQSKFGNRRCMSMCDLQNPYDFCKQEIGEDERKIKSYPMSPRAKNEFERLENSQPQPDNCYAEGKLFDPNYRHGKQFREQMLNTLRRNGLNFMGLGNEGYNSDREIIKRIGRTQQKKRGRKNQYYAQIDMEDDIQGKLFDDILNNLDESDSNQRRLQPIQQLHRTQDITSNKFIQHTVNIQGKTYNKWHNSKTNSKLNSGPNTYLQSKQNSRDTSKERSQNRSPYSLRQQQIQNQSISNSKESSMERNTGRSKKSNNKNQNSQRSNKSQKQNKYKRQKSGLSNIVKAYGAIGIPQLNKEIYKLSQPQSKQASPDRKSSNLPSFRRIDQDESIIKEIERYEEEETYESLDKDDIFKQAKQDYDISRRTLTQGLNQDQIQGQDMTTANFKSIFDLTPQISSNASPKNKDQIRTDKQIATGLGLDSMDTQVAKPNQDLRNFNENDILGKFSKDHKGNIIILRDSNGILTDTLDRQVNERGYLINESGDVINNFQKDLAFFKSELDDKGEIPLPFSIERNNFNINHLKGDFYLNLYGQPVINNGRGGLFTDKKGRLVNRKGLLCDLGGNIIDKSGRKKFDRRYLTEDGNIQKLYNYNGRIFDINDVSGQFDQDITGNTLFRMNNLGQSIDNKGMKVNDRGYLINDNGDIINKGNKIIFDKSQLKNGEIPKIFPYTRFNINMIKGNYEEDQLGNPQIQQIQDYPNKYSDSQGINVNKKGYLIDENFNVIDQNGRIVFEKHLLDQDGDIPKVFRIGLLRRDSASSLSRLMNEIERDQSPYKNYVQNAPINGKIESQMKIKPRNSSVRSGSSYNSKMDETPSNYNAANLRFEQDQDQMMQYQDQDEEQKLAGLDATPFIENQIINEDDKELEPSQMSFYNTNRTGGTVLKGQVKSRDVSGFNVTNYNKQGGKNTTSGSKKKLRQLNGRVIEVYQDPSFKELMLAHAYGGQPKGQMVRKILPNRTFNITPKIKIGRGGQEDDQDTENLEILASSIAGFHNNETCRTQKAIKYRDQFIPSDIESRNNKYESTIQQNNESQMAVSEHHIRELRLKQKKLNELKLKKQEEAKTIQNDNSQIKTGEDEFKKMFGKNIDEFLEDSEWDINSVGNQSDNKNVDISDIEKEIKKIKEMEDNYLKRFDTQNASHTTIKKSRNMGMRVASQSNNKFRTGTQQDLKNQSQRDLKINLSSTDQQVGLRDARKRNITSHNFRSRKQNIHNL